MVLNEKVDVTDSTAYTHHEERYENTVSRFGLMILNVYLALGSDTRAAKYLGCSKRHVDRYLHEIGVNGYGGMVDYSVKHNKNARKQKNSTHTENKTQKCSMNYRNKNNIACHEFIDGINHYGIICDECGLMFDSANDRQKYCSDECRFACKRLLKISDKYNVKNMLMQGKSLREIGRYYGVNHHSVAKFIERIGLHEYINISDNHDWNIHIRWHVRRDKPDMKKCEYCKTHDGFDSTDIVKIADRTRICGNPLCKKGFKSKSSTKSYCSNKCCKFMQSYNSLFSIHIKEHVNKHRDGSYCWFCEQHIMSSDDYTRIDSMDMVHGCDEVIAHRDAAAMRMRNDEHMTMNTICDETGLSKFLVNKIIHRN